MRALNIIAHGVHSKYYLRSSALDIILQTAALTHPIQCAIYPYFRVDAWVYMDSSYLKCYSIERFHEKIIALVWHVIYVCCPMVVTVNVGPVRLFSLQWLYIKLMEVYSYWYPPYIFSRSQPSLEGVHRWKKDIHE